MQTPHASRGAISIAVFIVALAAALLGPSAGADDRTPLGGGASILVDGRFCTLNTIGHDKTGELVGFTAAHCGGPGAAVLPRAPRTMAPWAPWPLSATVWTLR
jgi:hypothetical protein